MGEVKWGGGLWVVWDGVRVWVGTGVVSVWWGRVRGGLGVGWQVRLDGGIEGGFGSGEKGSVLAQGGYFFWDGLPMYPICTSAISAYFFAIIPLIFFLLGPPRF